MPALTARSWIFALTVALTLASAPARAQELKAGDDAPDFTMVGSDGKSYQLSDFKDKQAVVVAWYPRAFTGGCTRECKSFKEQGEALRKFQVAYFTASCDPATKNKDFAESLGVDYPILSDPAGKVATAYGVFNPARKAARRTTFIIGANGKILHVDKSVKTSSHGQDIAKKLKELGVAKVDE